MILVRSILSITGTPSNGSLPIGNGQGFTVNTLTAGTNITITNGPGTITIDASGGGGTPGGSTNEIQYNNAGAFGANSNLQWDITNSRAIIGTETVADTNSRLVVIGKGQSTNTTFAVHNQLGNNNALIVRDDGFVGFSGLPFASPFKFRFNLATNANLSFSNPSGTITRISSTNDTNAQAQQLNINASTLLFEQSATEYGRLDANEWRFQTRPFNINRNQAGGGETSILNLNNTGVQANATITLTYNISTTTPYVQLKGTTGTLNTTASNYQIHVRNKPSSALVEVARFTGNGGVIIGGTIEDENAILDLQSTTKGVLFPRLTTTDINNIVSPATGLTVYNTTENTICFYNGTAWQKVNHANL